LPGFGSSTGRARPFSTAMSLAASIQAPSRPWKRPGS
jgi:hypothetical protein